MGQEILNELTLRIAGESGEGVITVAESICRVAARMGLHLATYRTFPPEIKGGACMMQFRASAQPIFHHNDQADVLVAFNEEALLDNISALRANGTLMYEADIEGSIPPLDGIDAVAIPFRR